ncbi:hypothetical protein ACSU64_04795 [Bacillaceae bacterium C204]|uniref:hypothetical protein n=1 Tax=Neobacillus sp. 204 TaxID=3383351 RepID=UPI00397B740C
MQKASTVILSAGLLLTGFLGACANANQDISKNEITPEKVSTENQINTDNQGKHLGWQNERNPHYVTPKSNELIIKEFAEATLGREVTWVGREYDHFPMTETFHIYFNDPDNTYSYNPTDNKAIMEKVNEVYGTNYDVYSHYGTGASKVLIYWKSQ